MKPDGFILNSDSQRIILAQTAGLETPSLFRFHDSPSATFASLLFFIFFFLTTTSPGFPFLRYGPVPSQRFPLAFLLCDPWRSCLGRYHHSPIRKLKVALAFVISLSLGFSSLGY